MIRRRLNESRLRKHKDKAATLVEKGKYAKALPLYREILEAFPDDTGIMLKIGDLCKRLNMRDEAIAVYANAAAHLANKGILLQAIAVCRLLLEVDPTHRETQRTLADLYARKYGTAQSPEDEPPRQEVLPEDCPDGMTVPPEELAPMLGADEDLELVIDFSEVVDVQASDGDDEEDTDAMGEEGGEALEDSEDTESPLDASMPGDMTLQISRPAPAISDLPDIPLFSSLDRESFIALLEGIPVRDYDALETVVQEGEPGDSFFVIVTGSVEVFKGEESIAVLEEGTFFGEMAIIVPGQRQASVITAEPCQLLEITNRHLDALRDRFPLVCSTLVEFAESRLLNNLLLTSPVFVPFNDEERRSLVSRFVPYLYEPGRQLIEEGASPEGMYLIVSGSVSVQTRDSQGAHVDVATLRAGDIVGEMSLLTRKPATATVTTLESCRLLLLARDRFNEIIMTHPQILELISGISDERHEVLDTLKRPLASSRGGGTALL